MFSDGPYYSVISVIIWTSLNENYGNAKSLFRT
jgi:hypothetical protein